jgi:hypothetical protein
MFNPECATSWVVLVYARPHKLVDCINSIRTFDPNGQIMVFVDKLNSGDERLQDLQNEVVDLCDSLLFSGKITHWKMSEINLGTKRAFWELLKWGFNFSENLIYFEDDLVLTESPEKFIINSLEVMNSSENYSLACLFARSHHSISPDQLMRKSNWPELWGVLITKREFGILEMAKSSLTQEDIIHAVETFADNELNGVLTRLLKKRFRSIWEYKYAKSVSNRYAWDTELQLILWKLQKSVLLPLRTYVTDTGVDETSISKGKLESEIQECYSKISNFSDICLRCERLRESSNGLFDWKTMILRFTPRRRSVKSRKG